MKKVIIAIIVLFSLTGCGGNTAKSAVENYLMKYKNLDSEVLVDLENVVERENLGNEQSDKYRDILKKQYKDLSYKILEEEYDNDVSYVTVEVSVYDLYQAQSDASLYLSNNPEVFYNEKNEYDVNKYIDYKLDKMKDTTDKVEYTIVFTVTKENDKYVVEQPTDNDLEKIHGIYNYEMD